MKTLFLVRHAKSDHSFDLTDFERPLNERGHADAPKVARALVDKGFRIDHFISSPAKRALTTCRYFAEIFGNSAVQKEEDLYEPMQEDFVKTIVNVKDEHASVALFSHNPTISEYATSLADQRIDFPTCGVAVFEIDTDHWTDFSAAEKKLVLFLSPKDL